MKREVIENEVFRLCGAYPRFRMTSAGTLYGLRLAGDKYVCSLAPIDDESDLRFAAALVASWRAAKAGDEPLPLPEELSH